MKMEEIEKLQKLKANCLISVDSFYSTTRSKDKANAFMAGDENQAPVLYEIECDLRLETKPYADISSEKFGPFPDEKEVLFMVGTIFKFKGITYDQKLKHWRVKLQLFNKNNHHLSKLQKSIENDMGEKATLLNLTGLLYTAGDYEHALRIYMRSLFDLLMLEGDLTEYGKSYLTKSLLGIASVQGELGRYDESIELFDDTIKFINDHEDMKGRNALRATAYLSKSTPLHEKGNYTDALKQCKQALAIFTKYYDANDPFVPNCYETIGNIHGSLGRLEKNYIKKRLIIMR